MPRSATARKSAGRSCPGQATSPRATASAAATTSWAEASSSTYPAIPQATAARNICESAGIPRRTSRCRKETRRKGSNWSANCSGVEKFERNTRQTASPACGVLSAGSLSIPASIPSKRNDGREATSWLRRFRNSRFSATTKMPCFSADSDSVGAVREDEKDEGSEGLGATWANSFMFSISIADASSHSTANSRRRWCPRLTAA